MSETLLTRDVVTSEHTLATAFLATAFLATTFLGAAATFLGAGAFFFPTEKVMSILKAATGATRRAAVTSFMLGVSFVDATKRSGSSGERLERNVVVKDRAC
jgi:hypothetical protein